MYWFSLPTLECMIMENKYCQVEQISHELHDLIYRFQQAQSWDLLWLSTGTSCLSEQEIISLCLSSLVNIKCTKCCRYNYYFIACVAHIQRVRLHFGIQLHCSFCSSSFCFPYNGRFRTSQPAATSHLRVSHTEAWIWNRSSVRRQIVQKMENTSISICYNHHVLIKNSCLLKPLAPW